MSTSTSTSRLTRVPRVPPSRGNRAALIAAILLPVIVLVELALPPGGPRRSLPASASAVTASDSRLILHPRTAHIDGVLAGGARLSGTLSPTIPGLNALHMVVHDPSGQVVRGGRLAVTVTMPGMSMAPIKVTLSAHGRAFSGAIRLPMFGRYKADVTVATAAGHYTGAAMLELPLPGF